LTLRAAAREAGVSHAAPKNHFGDVMGLLSDLAAVGFLRFRAAMEDQIRKSDSAPAQLEAIGRGYVAFARTHPDLFLLEART
jgi:AcrR family transcriptional regulator